MIELLFLLLPIAAAYGWYMGRRSATQNQRDQKQQLSEQYVAGLNYLLSDQADKAVDLFIDMIEVDNDTIDTHMALGSLFRRRGEVDRAIKIHQNILERSQISQEQYNIAALELARDFTAAGLLDRAEDLYKSIAGTKSHGEQATQELVSIYQQLKDWKQAIFYAERLSIDANTARIIAQFYCELAEESKGVGSDVKVKFLKKALKVDACCVRASIMLGQLHSEQGHWQQAIEHFQHVVEQDIELVTEVIKPLSECYQRLDMEGQFQHFLIHAVEKGAGASAVIVLAELLKKQGLEKDAETLELGQLRRFPSLKGFFHYMEYHVARIVEPEARSSLATLQKLVGQQLSIKPKYRCQSCGFSSNILQWQCPSCKSWGETKPVRGLDGE
ncbi:lipopolysaccharide assembly protein LapB [Echinimonas agarilytica]|uniref:Lipopolysaccharide assembly protein B n=1 Tax=Echinimonas agarilytica TaxID=1215918 RepID=A0AA41W5F8_9GAMM|nr:lipopolysaccharide assembly protein LapB [Echinimonas agarilytica]MCM2679354.1 lipopolysaccharide assembly protein LapB [Echinimonas agarilytica]